MNLKDYLDIIIKLKREPKKSDFFYSIIDSFIRDSYMNEIIENPLYKYYESDETIRGICNGNKSLSKECASEIHTLYDKNKMMSFFYSRTENFDDIKEKLQDFGFEIDLNEEYDEDVPSTLADLLAKILENISKGISETYPPLRKITIHNLEQDAFKNGYVKDGYLHLNGQVIKLPNHFTIEDLSIECDPPYIIELLKVYSKLSGSNINTIEKLESFPIYKNHLNEQTKCYYSAEALKRSLRDLFADGEDNFNILKKEVFDSIYETYVDLTLENGYQRLKNVLDIVIQANLNSSILLNIKGLVTVKDRRGICHILVNEGRIKSWVEVDYEPYL